MVSEERNLLVSRRSEQAGRRGNLSFLLQRDPGPAARRLFGVHRSRRYLAGLRTMFRCLQDDKFGPFLRAASSQRRTLYAHCH